jgi:hypothetical protein
MAVGDSRSQCQRVAPWPEVVMSNVNEHVGVAALARACKADDALWADRRHGPGLHRQERDDAVREAVDAGLSLEFIADRLGVRISDVENMARAAAVRS